MLNEVEIVQVEEEKMISGYRSAVRYGAMTPKQVLIKLNELEAEGNYIKSSIRSWLKNRIKKRV